MGRSTLMRETCTHENDSSERGRRINGSSNRPLLTALVRRSRQQIKFRSLKAEDAQFYWRQARRSARRTLSTFDHYMSGERFLYSVLVMLIAFVTLWMSFIFAILSGSMLILKLSIAALVRCGRSVRSLFSSSRN